MRPRVEGGEGGGGRKVGGVRRENGEVVIALTLCSVLSDGMLEARGMA